MAVSGTGAVSAQALTEVNTRHSALTHCFLEPTKNWLKQLPGMIFLFYFIFFILREHLAFANCPLFSVTCAEVLNGHLSSDAKIQSYGCYLFTSLFIL